MEPFPDPFFLGSIQEVVLHIAKHFNSPINPSMVTGSPYSLRSPSANLSKSLNRGRCVLYTI